MRITQVNSYMPIRQNRMAFRGEETKPAESTSEKPLSQQLAELDKKWKLREVTQEEAERMYSDILDKAAQKIVTGIQIDKNVNILTSTGEAYVRSIIIATRQRGDSYELRAEARIKIERISKAIDAIFGQMTYGITRNPILGVLREMRFR